MASGDIALNAANVESRCASVGSRVQDCGTNADRFVSDAGQAISDASGGARIEIDRFLASAEEAARNGLAAVEGIRAAMLLAVTQMTDVDADLASRADSSLPVSKRGDACA